jgi:heparanase 1
MGIWYGTIDEALYCFHYLVLLHQYFCLCVGNELSGTGIGASVRAEQYGKDLIKLKDIMNELYEKSHSRPSLIAPGGFVDTKWYTTLLDVSGSNVLNILTHHIYNLGAGEQL